ncbi:DUF6415 family natural product biosynthesis protein [Streptomyces sp. PmtG]
MTLTADQLDALLEAAFSACAELPPARETGEVHRRLVTEIELRLPTAEQAAATAREGSDAWHAHRRVIDATHDALAFEGVEPTPSDSPLNAAIRVAELGRRLRDLSVYTPQEPVLCWRCGHPIRPGERTETALKDSASAAGPEAVWHAGACPDEA